MRLSRSTRIAVRALPRAFRREYQDDLEATWAELRQDGRSTALGESLSVLRLAVVLRWRWLRDLEHAAQALVLVSAVGLVIGAFLPASLWATTSVVGQAGGYAGPSPTMRLLAVAVGVVALAIGRDREQSRRSVRWPLLAFAGTLTAQVLLASAARLRQSPGMERGWAFDTALGLEILVIASASAVAVAVALRLPAPGRLGLVALGVVFLSGAVALATLAPVSANAALAVHMASAGPAFALAALAFCAAALSAFAPSRVRRFGPGVRPGSSR